MAVRIDPDGVETRAIHGLVDFSGKDVLEIGCGDGRMTWSFAHEAASVIAIDPKEVGIAAANASTPDALKSRVSFRVADICAIDLTEDAYDVAILSWSL